MSTPEKFDITNLAFIYNNIVSYVNNICLDLDVVNQLGKLKLDNKITEANSELYHFLERRTYLSLVVTLDFVLDDTNSDREELKRIHNASLNIDKLLCALQDSFRNEKDNSEQKKLNENWKKLKDLYQSIQDMPQRKNLSIYRNKLGAHVDLSFIKKDQYEDLDLSPRDFAKMIYPLCDLVNGIGSMIHFEGMASIKPHGPDRSKTPIDDLF